MAASSSPSCYAGVASAHIAVAEALLEIAQRADSNSDAWRAEAMKRPEKLPDHLGIVDAAALASSLEAEAARRTLQAGIEGPVLQVSLHPNIHNRSSFSNQVLHHE
eukprot:4100740-Amphidinium_carterae.1